MSESQERYLHQQGAGMQSARNECRPPKESRLESAMNRRASQLKTLNELAARAEHLADKWCGSSPAVGTDEAGANLTNAGSLIGALELQNDDAGRNINRILTAMDRLQSL